MKPKKNRERMPTDWTPVLWGAGLGVVLTVVLLNVAPGVVPFVEKPATPEKPK